MTPTFKLLDLHAGTETNGDPYRPRTWSRVLAPLVGMDGLNALEIGTCEGQSAIWFFEHVLTGAGCHMTCIDPWSAPGMVEVYNRFVSNLAAAGLTHRFTIYRDTSQNVLPTLDERFDLVYIDGNHDAAHVLFDGCFAWSMLNDDGIMIFDDYAWGLHRRPERQTKIGVDMWLDLHAGEYELLERGFQVIVRRV